MTKLSPKKTKKKTSNDKPKSSTSFEKKLKSKCKNCTTASIKVYLAAIKRLHRLISDGDLPETGAWLNKKELMEKYEKQPLGKRRHLSLAAVKAGQAYGQKADKWQTKMFRDQSQYQQIRNRNERTPSEKKIWPKHGFKAIKQVTREQRRRITHILKEEPSLKRMYPYQTYMILKLFKEIPFRNTFADLSLKDKSKNFVNIPKKGNITFQMKQYKNSKQLGETEVKVSRGATTALRKFIKYREGLVKHDWLFSTKSGQKLSRAALGKILHKVTKDLLGKSFGSRLIRILHATDSKEEIEKVAELANKMLHTTKQTKQYVRKS